MSFYNFHRFWVNKIVWNIWDWFIPLLPIFFLLYILTKEGLWLGFRIWASQKFEDVIINKIVFESGYKLSLLVIYDTIDSLNIIEFLLNHKFLSCWVDLFLTFNKERVFVLIKTIWAWLSILLSELVSESQTSAYWKIEWSF